jgi:hypothetical protein
MRPLIVALLVAAPAVWPQEQKLNLDFGDLAAKAKETVEVTLDASMLQFASGFLSERKVEEAEAKKLISGLKGIIVRVFEFEKPGEYSMADVEKFRSQLRAPAWSRIVEVRSKADAENVDVFLKREGSQVNGLVVIAAEPKELAVVVIDGPIRPEDLAKLGGQMGIPRIDLGQQQKKKED